MMSIGVGIGLILVAFGWAFLVFMAFSMFPSDNDTDWLAYIPSIIALFIGLGLLHEAGWNVGGFLQGVAFVMALVEAIYRVVIIANQVKKARKNGEKVFAVVFLKRRAIRKALIRLPFYISVMCLVVWF